MEPVPNDQILPTYLMDSSWTFCYDLYLDIVGSQMASYGSIIPNDLHHIL